MGQVFISYSSNDRTLAEKLSTYLENQFDEVSVWLDKKSLHSGDEWWKEILEAIEGCNLFIYLISVDSMGSEYCKEEVRKAIDEGKLIIPVLLGLRPDNLTLIGDEKIIAGLDSRHVLEIMIDFNKEAKNKLKESVCKHLELECTKPDKLWICENANQKRICLSRVPVTVKMFKNFISNNGYNNESWWEGVPQSFTRVLPSLSDGRDDYPITEISWWEATAYCKWFGSQQLLEIRLPTADEWDQVLKSTDHEGIFGNVRGKDLDELMPVGSSGELPNELQDVKGNVRHWCQNSSGFSWKVSNEGMEKRSVRGCSWRDEKRDCRAKTHWADPIFKSDDLGFRLLRVDMYKKYDVDMNGQITINRDTTITRDHKLWHLLSEKGAQLKGDRNPLPVQIKDQISYIEYEVRRGFTEASGLKIGEAPNNDQITLLDAFIAGDDHPFWQNTGLDARPLFWGAAAIVYYLDEDEKAYVLLGKKTKKSGSIEATFGSKLTPPAGMVEMEDFVSSDILGEALVKGAWRELTEEVSIGRFEKDKAILVLNNGMEITVDAETKVETYIETERCKPQAFVFIKLDEGIEVTIGRGNDKEFHPDTIKFYSFEMCKGHNLSSEAKQAFRELGVAVSDD